MAITSSDLCESVLPKNAVNGSTINSRQFFTPSIAAAIDAISREINAVYRAVVVGIRDALDKSDSREVGIMRQQSRHNRIRRIVLTSANRNAASVVRFVVRIGEWFTATDAGRDVERNKTLS